MTQIAHRRISRVSARPNKHVVLALACWITQANFQLMLSAPDNDRKRCISEALLLLLVTIVLASCWTLFFSTFWPLYASVFAGILVGLIVALLDQAMGAAEWSPGGFLDGRGNGKNWPKYVVRVGIAFVLSFATGTGVALAMYAGALDNRQIVIAERENESLERRYDDKERALSGRYERLIDMTQSEERKLVERQDQLVAQLAEVSAESESQAREVVRWQTEQVLEEVGQGRAEGKGKDYLSAVQYEKAANARVGQAEKRKAELKLALIPLGTQVSELKERVETLRADYKAEIASLENRRLNDSARVSPSSDPLSNFVAFLELRGDSRKGRAVQWIHALLMGVIICLELSYVMVRSFLRPPSIYWVRMNTLIRKLALEESRRLDDFVARSFTAEPAFVIKSLDPSDGD